jgi:hypothetical protein
MLGDAGVERITGNKFRTANQSKAGFWDDEMEVTALAADRAVTLGSFDSGGRLDLKLDAPAVAPAEMFGQKTTSA